VCCSVVWYAGLSIPCLISFDEISYVLCVLTFVLSGTQERFPAVVAVSAYTTVAINMANGAQGSCLLLTCSAL
jgi:hypothetical protein